MDQQQTQDQSKLSQHHQQHRGVRASRITNVDEEKFDEESLKIFHSKQQQHQV